MELFIFACFHARDGQQDAVGAAALRDVLPPTRAEPGCSAAEAYRATRDPLLFYIHSRWADEAAFNSHAELPHTMRFLERVQPLIDHPLDVTCSRRIGQRRSLMPPARKTAASDSFNEIASVRIELQ